MRNFILRVVLFSLCSSGTEEDYHPEILVEILAQIKVLFVVASDRQSVWFNYKLSNVWCVHFFCKRQDPATKIMQNRVYICVVCSRLHSNVS